MWYLRGRESFVKMNHYCTLFDSFYLTRGLALYRSLVRSGEVFNLYIFCFDDLTFTLLGKMALPQVTLVSLREFETPKLLAAKTSRTRGEYCWTCTPHVIRYTLDRFKLPELTYLDADLYFFQKPSILLEEFRSDGASILITEHRYTPAYDQSRTSGVYCVQFITFRSDSNGLATLQWWQDRCLEWCYARVEEGKFGDQKYLDDWLTRFKGVHVLKHLGGGVAPWNVQQYKVSEGPKVNGVPVVFYHFHALKWLSTGHFDICGGYRISRNAVRFLYAPYLEILRESLAEVRKLDAGFQAGKIEPARGWKVPFQRLKGRLEGSYCVVKE